MSVPEVMPPRKADRSLRNTTAAVTLGTNDRWKWVLVVIAFLLTWLSMYAINHTSEVRDGMTNDRLDAIGAPDDIEVFEMKLDAWRHGRELGDS